MAWIFSLAIEFGDDADARNVAAAILEAIELPVASRLQPVRFGDADGGLWLLVEPEGLSRTGLSNEADAAAATSAGWVLYDALRQITGYRYAIVGLEVDEFRTYPELLDGGAGGAQTFHGLVLHPDLYDQLGCPADFEPFAEGYVWLPWRGVGDD